MSTFFKYPEIVRLEKRPEILSVKQVVATEKLHGTNFRLLFPAGMASIDEIQYSGRNEEFGDGEGKSFYGGRPVRWFKDQPALLRSEERRVGKEWRERLSGDQEDKKACRSSV